MKGSEAAERCIASCALQIDGYMAGPARPTDGFSLVRVYEHDLRSSGGGDPFRAPSDVVGALHKILGVLQSQRWRCDATLKPFEAFEV